MPDPVADSFAPQDAAGGWAFLALAVGTALAAGVAAGWLALRSGGPAAAEGVFLAGLAASLLALLAPAALARGAPRVAAPSAWCLALLLALVAQLAPLDGPLRAAALGAALAIAVAAAWLGVAEGGGSECDQSLDLAVALPLCVATQVLARAPLLIEVGPGALATARAALELVGLPAAAALAVAALPRPPAPAARDRPALALLLAVVAAGRFHASMVATLAVFALLPRVLDRRLTPAQRLLCAVPLVALAVLRPAVTVVAVAAALAVPLRRGWPAALLVASGILLWLETPRPWYDALAGPLLLVALLPIAIVAAWNGRGASPAPAGLAERSERGHGDSVTGGGAFAPVSPFFLLGAATLLALVSLRALEPRAGLVAPALLLARGLPLAVPSALRFAQTVWLSLLLALGLAVQGLPWLRTPGVGDLLALLGWRDLGALAALACALAGLFLFAVAVAARNRATFAALASILLPALLGAVLLLPATRDLRHTATALDWPARALTAEEPAVVAMLDVKSPPRALVIDTALAHGGTLPAGTPVARVRLREKEGDELLDRALRVGRDTGEWVAGSPALRDAAAPAPYLVAIAEGGGFFAKRYRARIELDPAKSPATTAPATRLELTIEREPALPDDVVVTVFGVQTRGARPSGHGVARR